MAILTERVGLQVRAQREARGMSRAKLAQICNVSISTIDRLENNGQLPGTAAMFAIAGALEMDLNALAGDLSERISA